MKYIVMECNLSYAVVLDEEGRFFNVANRNYKVGQTTTDVIKMKDTQKENQLEAAPKKKTARWKYFAASVAACLVITMATGVGISQQAYASVYVTINPDVRVDINRSEIVVDIKGLNEDGEKVIEDYDYKKKKVDVVMDELMDRSIEKGYLHEGSRISLSFNGKNGKWILEKSETLRKHVETYLKGKVCATVEIEEENHALKSDPDKKWKKDSAGQNSQGVDSRGDSDYNDDTPASTGSSTNGNSNYGNTDYGNSNYGNTDYGNSTNGSAGSEGKTPQNRNTESANNGNSAYGSSNYENLNSSNSDYGQTDQQKAQEEAEKKAEEEQKAREEAEKKAEEEQKAREEAEKKAQEEADKEAEKEQES